MGSSNLARMQHRHILRASEVFWQSCTTIKNSYHILCDFGNATRTETIRKMLSITRQNERRPSCAQLTYLYNKNTSFKMRS